MAAYLNYRVDELIIAALLPPEQLGFYVIAVGLVERLWILPGSVANALLPHLTMSREHDPALPAVIARHVIIWTGAACLLIFALADLVVQVLYSSAFAPTIAPVRWLLPGIFTLSIGRVLVAELLAREKSRYLLWASGVAASVEHSGQPCVGARYGHLRCGARLVYLIFSPVAYSNQVLPARDRYGVDHTGTAPDGLLDYTPLWDRFIHAVPVRSGTTGGARS